ncbi:MAG: xanthine permease, partial [candidate division Zixibacteria bacterium RBG_16_40_9]
MWYKIFKLKEFNSSPKTEFLAGLTTFLTMSYIIFVNPMFLSFFGDPELSNLALPVSASITATCLAAALMCFCMGIWSNYPFALAPGMGLNAIVAYQMVVGLKLSWPEAMGVIVMEGLIITFLVITGFREAVMTAIPQSLKQAISVGIGLFLTFIGLIQAGLVKKSESTLVTLGDFDNWGILVSLLGLFSTAILMKRKVKGAILLGILVSTLVAVIVNSLTGFKAFAGDEIAKLPSSLISLPDFSTFGDFNFGALGKLGLLSCLILVFSVMLSDFFDTLGSVVGLGTQGNFLDAKGNLPKINRVLLVDSVGAALGGVACASSVTTYIESAAGISSGGRSGLTAVVVGMLFLLGMFFSPVVKIVPKEAVASALIIVGFLMLSIIKEIPFARFEEGFPSFLIIVLMPLTYSISNGIGLGFMAYVLIMFLSGKAKEVPFLLY